MSEINNDKEYSMIAGVIVENSTVFSSEQILPSYFGVIGKATTADHLSGIESRIISTYTQNSYFPPLVRVASHPEFNNIFLVTIAEPVLLSFKIEGGWGDKKIEAANYLDALVGSSVVDEKSFSYLESSLEHRLKTGIEISRSPLNRKIGGFDIVVRLTGDISAKVHVSNQGNKKLGRETVFAEIEFIEQVSGFNTIYLNTFNSLDGDAFRSLGLGFDYELNEGNSLRFYTRKSRARYEDINQLNDLIYETALANIEWQHKLVEKKRLARYFQAKFSLRDLERENNIVDIEESLRIINFRYWQKSLGKNNSTFFSADFTKGIDSMGAALRGSAVDQDIELDFSRYQAQLTFNQYFSKNVSFNLRMSGQYSQDTLPYSERFVIARSSIAPAYESGEISGDSGVGFKAEIARGANLSLLSSRWVPYAYYGAGKTRNNIQKESISAGSVGVGLRWFNKQMSLYCELGKPLIQDSSYRESNPRLAAGLTLWF